MHFPTFTILTAALSLTSVIAIANPVVTLAVRDGNVARHAAFQAVAKRQDDGTGETGETGTGETGTGETGTGEEGTGTGEEAGTGEEGTGEDIASCKLSPSVEHDQS